MLIFNVFKAQESRPAGARELKLDDCLQGLNVLLSRPAGARELKPRRGGQGRERAESRPAGARELKSHVNRGVSNKYHVAPLRGA